MSEQAPGLLLGYNIMRAHERVCALVLFAAAASARCFDPSPAFPVPIWNDAGKDLAPAFEIIEKKLEEVVADHKYNASSFSVEVTSNKQTLWSQYHTARTLNKTRPGVQHVDGDSLYRIASITKVFTTLGVLYQHETGNLTLDSPISKYIPELGGDIPWKDITLRILASQLSGIPREFAQSDVINSQIDPSELGLPPASKKGLPPCDEYNNYRPCNSTDLINWLNRLKPLFAPNQKSTYSNVNFELLGLALERVTGMKYADYVREAIFEPLHMAMSSIETPPDKHAVLPVGDNYWGVDEGVQNPTGAIYSCSTDMSKFVRYILTHFNAIATGVNWVMPASWSTGLQSFYGMPFEIFRTGSILQDSQRPVTFVTKSGGLPGYVSRISIMLEYGLGLTVLVGGESDLLSEIQEVVTVTLVQAAEKSIWREVDNKYTGFYVAANSSLNSSLEITSSPSAGLVINAFISNGTDVFNTPILTPFNDQPWHLQLIPTLLFKKETEQKGEIWRMVVASERREDTDADVWDEFCLTDVDPLTYAGLPLNEVVFWHEEGVVELPAWGVKMRASPPEVGDSRFVVQV